MSAPIPLDVAIIGGGVSALWILRQIQQNRLHDPLSVLLFAGDGGVGGGQSSHSHAFLHRGHYVIGSFPVPSGWLQSLPATLQQAVRDQLRSSLKGFVETPETLTLRQEFEKAAESLESVHLDTLLCLGASAWAAAIPREVVERKERELVAYLATSSLNTAWIKRRFGDGTIEKRFASWHVEEDWIDPNRVLGWLSSEYADKIVIGRATLSRSDEAFLVASNVDGNRLDFLARTVVVAAGKHNRHFLQSLNEPTDSLNEVSMYELVFRGDNSIGPQIAGRRAGGVHRQGSPTLHSLMSVHSTKYGPTWLFTDGRTIDKSGGLSLWLKTALEHLSVDLSFTNFGDFKWHVDCQTMHEWRTKFDADSPYLSHWSVHEVLHGAAKAIFAWPSKLTLAPLLASDVEQRIPVDAYHRQPSMPRAAHKLPEPPWDVVGDFLEWNEFRAKYSLPEAPPRTPGV